MICAEFARVCVVALAILAGGCQGLQLRTTTLDLNSILESTERGQVLQNLGKIAEQNYVIPAHVLLGSGTVQVVNTLSPSFSFPLTSMFAHTTSAIPSKVATIAGAGGSIGGSIAWEENFIVAPVTDPLFLRNANLLYRSVLDVSQADISKPTSLLAVYRVPHIYNEEGKLVVDPYYLSTSNCIFCLKEGVDPPTNGDKLFKLAQAEQNKTDPKIIVNDVFTYQWLYCQPSCAPGGKILLPPGDVHYVGTSNGRSFYVADSIPCGPQPSCTPKNGQKLFSDFILLMLPLSNPPTPPSSKPPAPGKKPLAPRTVGNSDALRPPSVLYSQPLGIQ